MLGIGCAALAQVVFELPGALPAPGVYVEEGWTWNGTLGNLPTTGTNVTWDLTDLLDASSSRTVTDAPPAGTPGEADFPNATHAYAEELNGVTSWYYYHLDASDSLWLEGVKFENGDLFTCDPPNLYMFFPYAMGDFAESNTTCTLNGFPFDVNQGLVPVATGTVIHPGGNLSGVVMVQSVYAGSPGEYYWYLPGNALRWIGSYAPNNSLQFWGAVPTVMDGRDAHAAARVYPVPANDAVWMVVPSAIGTARCSLLDNTGRSLFSGQVPMLGGRVRLDVSAFPPGQYLLQVEAGGTLRVGRAQVVR